MCDYQIWVWPCFLEYRTISNPLEHVLGDGLCAAKLERRDSGHLRCYVGMKTAEVASMTTQLIGGRLAACCTPSSLAGTSCACC